MQTPALQSPRSRPRGSVAIEIASAFGLAALAVLACTLPATLRVSERGVATVTAPRVWLALATTAFAPMVCGIFVLRGAREGLRAFSGAGSGGARIRALGVGVGLSALLVGLSIFATLLRVATHNRALAGVTFAMGGLALVVGVAVVSGRVVALLEQASPQRRTALGVAIALAVASAVAWTGLRFASAAGRDAASSASAGIVVDVLAFGLAALFAARPSFAERRSLALAGPVVAVLVAVWGLSALRDPALRAAIEDIAPAFAPLADLVPST